MSSPAVTVLVQEDVENPGDVVTELLLRDPAGDTAELLQVNTDSL